MRLNLRNWRSAETYYYLSKTAHKRTQSSKGIFIKRKKVIFIVFYFL